MTFGLALTNKLPWYRAACVIFVCHFCHAFLLVYHHLFSVVSHFGQGELGRVRGVTVVRDATLAHVTRAFFQQPRHRLE